MKLPDFTALGDNPTPRPPQGIASYEATTGMEGAPAAALSKAGAEVGNAAETFAVMKDRQDTLRAEEAYNKLRQKQTDMTYGKDGFANLKGGDAVNRPILKEYGGAFDQAAADVSSTLDNDYQKKLFQRRAEVSGLQLRENIVRHVAAEQVTYTRAVNDATVKTEVQNAGLAGGNELDFQMALHRANNAIDAQATAEGLKPTDAPVTLAKQAALDQANALRVKTVMNTDPLAAEALYKQVEPSLNAQTRMVLGHELKIAVTPVRAKLIADKAMTEADADKIATTIQVSGNPQAAAQGDVIAPPAGKQTRAGFDAMLASAGESGKVTPSVQIERDQKRLDLLRTELNSPNSDANDRKMIGREIADTEARLAGLRADAAKGEQPAAQGVTPVNLSTSATPTRTRDTRAMLGTWISRGEQLANEAAPNDPLLRDAVIQNIKGKVATIVSMQDGQQKQAQGALIQASIGMNGIMPTTTQQLFSVPGAREAFVMMDEQAQRGILSLLDHNARTMSGENVRSNPAVVQATFNRIHADENDPNKIRSITQLAPLFAPDASGNTQLNRSDYDWMSREIEKSRNPEGNSFLRDVNNVRNTANRVMRAGIMGRMLADTQPEKIEEAAYAFNVELDQKIDAYRKAGKDPRLLLTPGTPDYVLTPGHVQSFLQTPGAAMGDAANKVRASQYEAGKEYTFRQGKMRFKGGDASVQANWESVK